MRLVKHVENRQHYQMQQVLVNLWFPKIIILVVGPVIQTPVVARNNQFNLLQFNSFGIKDTDTIISMILSISLLEYLQI